MCILEREREIRILCVRCSYIYTQISFLSDHMCGVRCTHVLRGATVLVQVTENGHALEYASEELKADKEIVLAAVCGCAQMNV